MAMVSMSVEELLEGASPIVGLLAGAELVQR